MLEMKTSTLDKAEVKPCVTVIGRPNHFFKFKQEILGDLEKGRFVRESWKIAAKALCLDH